MAANGHAARRRRRWRRVPQPPGPRHCEQAQHHPMHRVMQQYNILQRTQLLQALPRCCAAGLALPLSAADTCANGRPAMCPSSMQTVRSPASALKRSTQDSKREPGRVQPEARMIRYTLPRRSFVSLERAPVRRVACGGVPGLARISPRPPALLGAERRTQPTTDGRAGVAPLQCGRQHH
jgi:hypothetical protein